MRTSSIPELLDRHPFFADLDVSDRALLAGCGHNVRFASGEMIFREGDPADELYVIRKGRVALEVHAPGRGPIVIDTLTAGDVLGASWLIPPHRRHLDARATSPTAAISLDCGCLRTRCDEDPELGYRLMTRFAGLVLERLRAARLQLLDLYGAHDGAGTPT